jgi:HD-like signal output (HDOD) protein
MTWQEWIENGSWQEHSDTAMPMLPALANEILRLALDPEVSAARISTVVAKDPVLATRVIRLANSAFSAPVVEISTISEAVVRVGTRAVRNVVVAECMASRLKDPRIYGDEGRTLIDHSIGTAYLAWLISDRVRESPDEAFLYGLLHDIGKLLLLKLAYDYQKRFAVVLARQEVDAVVAGQHAGFGGHLLQQWHLPPTLDDPVMWHHEPEKAQQNPRAARVAYAANRLAHRYGFGCPRDEFDPLGDPRIAEAGIDGEGLAQIDSHAPGLFEVARKIVR